MKNYLSHLVCCLSLCAALHSCTANPDADTMRRELLRARTMNTNRIPFTLGEQEQSPDSIMRVVADYYDRHGTATEQAEAHYLLGCVYRDMGQAPQALKCYHDAVERADSTADRQLLIKVYGQMAELFDAQNLPADEVAAMREIQQLALLEHDSLMYIRALELMTKPYYKLGDTAKVIQTVWQAHRLYTEAGDSRKAVSAFATLAHIMVKRGRLAEADSLLRVFEDKAGLMDSSGNIERGREMYYYIRGNYYLQAGKTDSAEFFMRRLLPHNLNADAYRGLLAVYQKRNATDSIAKYARLFEAAVDSQNNQRRIETVHQMAALYDYHRFQQKADREALAAEKAGNRANIAIVLLVLTATLAVLFFIRYRKSKQKELETISNECLVVSTLLAKARMELDEERQAANDSIEAEMQEKMEEKSDEVKQLEEKLHQLEDRYRSVTQLDSREKRKNSEAVKAIRKRAEWRLGADTPSADDWEKLTNQFRLDFPHYYAFLTQGTKLSTYELRTAILLLLDFKEGEIAVLLDVKPQRVTNIKKRTNLKLFDDNSASTLTDNLTTALNGT